METAETIATFGDMKTSTRRDMAFILKTGALEKHFRVGRMSQVSYMEGSMNQPNPEMLLRLAAKYIWWKSPEEAVISPQRVIAQVMNIGDYEDVQVLAKELGDPYLIEVLRGAEIGQFNVQSWAYWHYRLDLSKPGQVPALPMRKIA